MKTTSVLLLAFLVSAARFADAEDLVAATATGPIAEINQPDAAAAKMVGSYVGMFGENKITVYISKIIGTSVIGYSVVAGNERAFSGAITPAGDDLKIDAKEPGDHPEDGTFSFVYLAADKALKGSWQPNNQKLEAKTFYLTPREFKYNPKAGFYPQSSTKLLTEADVENTPPEDLRIMRNEIYARHGYSFRLKEMRDYFDHEEWYMPVSSDIMNTLTKTEWANDILIKRYEKYAQENYDSYGR